MKRNRIMLTVMALVAVSTWGFATPQPAATTATQDVRTQSLLAEYKNQLSQIQRDYLAKLNADARAAIAAGKKDEAEEIQQAQQMVAAHRIGDIFDPFAQLESEMTGVRLESVTNPSSWTRFDRHHQTSNRNNDTGKWAVVGDDTIASTVGSTYIYLWTLSPDRQFATSIRFALDKRYEGKMRRGK